jgi:hypothetical protein
MQVTGRRPGSSFNPHDDSGRACKLPDVVAMLPWPNVVLHFGQRSAAIDRVSRVSVPEPMRRDRRLEAGARGGAPDAPMTRATQALLRKAG